MPFDSEGVFSRVHNWEDDRQNDIDICSDRMDEEDNNFATGLSECFLRNGLSKMNGDFDAGNFKVRNVANGATNNDAVNYGQLNTAVADIQKLLDAFKAKFQEVDELPENPDEDTYYFIPEA